MINFDQSAFIVFIIIMTIFLYSRRKKVVLQKLLFPLFYMVLYKTGFGLKWMDKVSTKHRNLVQIFGYSCIGFGFLGMIWVSVSVLFGMLKFFLAPKATDVGIVLVLPGTTIPGIGFLSFFHFIIAIVILAVVHEFAHGVVMRSHDIPVKSSGFAFLGILLPIIPAAFVEPDEKKMAKREAQVQYSVLAAGPIANICLAVVFFLILTFAIVPVEKNITTPVGFSFDVTEGLPADIAGIESGTLINTVNGEKVTDSSQFVRIMLQDTGPGDAITLGNDDASYTITTVSHPDDDTKGFVGVTTIKNEGRFKPEYKSIGGAFFWVKGLVRWLFLLNLFIGLMNLLPIYITDGAKMLFVAISGSVKNKKKAFKVWNIVNFLFVFLILVGLVATYLKRFGLF